MKGHGAKLPRKQQQAIASLLNCPTVVEAAKAVGVAEVTIHRWLATPQFKEAFRKARAQIVDQAIIKIQQAASEAVKTLQDIATGLDRKDSARVSAAKAILDHTLRATELESLASRIDRIENILAKEDSVK
jgi:dsDNA-specific endonuclease/ATPase MutS2